MGRIPSGGWGSFLSLRPASFCFILLGLCGSIPSNSFPPQPEIRVRSWNKNRNTANVLSPCDVLYLDLCHSKLTKPKEGTFRESMKQ